MSDYDEIDVSPAGFFRGFWRWFGVGVFVIALGVGLAFGGQRLGWWFQSNNVNHQAHMIQQGYSNQSSQEYNLAQQIDNVFSETNQIDAAGVTKAQALALKGQRSATVQQACQSAAQITLTLPPSEAGWVSRNCLGAAINPSSPYYATGN